MIVVGCCVGPGGRFRRIAGPSLETFTTAGDEVVLIEGASGICAAYNAVMKRARTLEACEGVVLLHDDLELFDGVRAEVLKAVAEPGVGLVGVVGGSDLVHGKWWSGRRVAGRVIDSRGDRHLGPASADVDAVDGCLLVVAPAALSLDFDESSFPDFHGYDVDFSLQVREAGLRVVTRELGCRHHDKGSAGDVPAFERAMRALEAKWPTWIRPLSRWERLARRTHRAAAALT